MMGCRVFCISLIKEATEFLQVSESSCHFTPKVPSIACFTVKI